MDAMLGALCLGDIGLHFPPTDEKYKDISSIKLLHHTNNLIREKGYKIVNIDSTILAEKPKLLPYILEIRKSLATELNIKVDDISVKATTTEKTDAIGEGIAIAAQAIILLEKI